MRLTFQPISGTLADVFDTLRDRDPGDPAWLRTVDDVQNCIVGRTERLNTTLWQVVRLVRLSGLCSPVGDYIDLLYLRVERWKPDFFRSKISDAIRFRPALGSALVIGLQEVLLLEPEMSTPTGENFGLAFSQMPRLAAFLDVLHNTLPYAHMADLLAPLLTLERPICHADEIARELRSSFNGFLADHLESNHLRQKARIAHDYLVKEDALHSTKFNDQLIFSFWRERALHWHATFQDLRKQGTPSQLQTAERAASDEGTRVFGEAVRMLLRYRDALQRDETEQAIRGPSTAASRVEDVESDDALAQLHEPWVSPLVELTREPANKVKWLSDRDARFLMNYLGRCRAPAESAQDGADDELRSGALMEGVRFNMQFVKTLMRVDVFGAAQARIIAGLRRRQDPRTALHAGLATVGTDAYSSASETYHAIREQLHRTALATLYIFGAVGDPTNFFELLDQVATADEKRALSDHLAEAIRDVAGCAPHQDTPIQVAAAARALQDLFSAASRGQHDGIKDLLARTRQAYIQISRVGFEWEDSSIPHEYDAAFRAGASPLATVLKELARLLETLRKLDLRAAADADIPLFVDTFAKIYPSAP